MAILMNRLESTHSRVNRLFDTAGATLRQLDMTLILLAVASYHYFKALQAHGDPWYIAILTAVLIDANLLESWIAVHQYRKAQNVQKWERFGAIARALIISGYAFALQYRFFAGNLINETFENLIFASILPVLIVITAYILIQRRDSSQAADAEPVVTMDQALVERMVSQLADQIGTVNSRLDGVTKSIESKDSTVRNLSSQQKAILGAIQHLRTTAALPLSKHLNIGRQSVTVDLAFLRGADLIPEVASNES